jgi:predicted dienelactone hydrolase
LGGNEAWLSRRKYVISLNRRRRFLLWSLILAVLGILALLGALSWRRNREVILPSPGGPYPVGRIEYDWVDTRRPDPLAVDPQEPRKLNVWIWYPGERSSSTTSPAPYLPPTWIAAREHVAGIGTLLMQNFARVLAHSTTGLPLATAQASYPLLIMQPGLGPVLPDYTTLCEALASYGYVVVGSTPTGSASFVVFKDGQVAYGTPQGNIPETAAIIDTQRILGDLIQVWAGDDRFVLDQVVRLNAADPAGRFTGRIDLDAVGVLGHSFGGASAAQFCSLDARCKAGVDLDGYPYGDVIPVGLHQPFMFLWSEPPSPNDPAWLRAKRDTEAIFHRLPPGSLQATIDGTRHFNFADYAVEFEPLIGLLGELGPIDGAYGLRIITTYVRAFFDETLRHQHDPVLDANPSPYPEVHLVRR